MEYEIKQCSIEQYYPDETCMYCKNSGIKQMFFRKVYDSKVNVINDTCNLTSWEIIIHTILRIVTIGILCIYGILGKNAVAGNIVNVLCANYTENNLTGTWRWNSGDNYFDLRLTQNGNRVTGTYGAIWGSPSMDIDDGNTLNGN